MINYKNIKKIKEVNNNIGFVFATQIESKPFIKGLDLSKIEKKPFKIYNKDKI